MLTDSGGVRRLAASLLAAMCTALAGCTSDPPKAVEVNDTDASIVSARVAWRPAASKSGRVRHGFEIDYASHRGSGSQTINSGERIELDGATVFGPQILQHEVRTRYVHVAYSGILSATWDASAKRRLEIEWLGGFGNTNLALKSQGSAPATQAIDLKREFSGVVAGVSPRWWFNEHFAAEARLSYMFNIEDDRTAVEVALAWRLLEHLLLRAGYSRTSTNLGQPGDYTSNVDTTLRGPFLGLALDF